MRQGPESSDRARRGPINVGSFAIVISSVMIMIEKVYFWNPVNQQPEKDGTKEKARNNKRR